MLKSKLAKLQEDEFKPHWMYDPKTGEKERAEKPEDHERLKALGWGHEPPVDESTDLDEAVRPNDKVFVKGKNRDGKTISYFAFGGSFKEVKAFRRAIKKLLSDHAKKKFDVYVDGNSDLVDSDSSKTIVRFDDKMTVADVAKAVEEFINKEYPPKKAAPTVDYKTDTRTIITTDDEKAKELKKKYHGKGTKVRIMKRKSSNKVYIDSKTPEIHKAINDALADEMMGM